MISQEVSQPPSVRLLLPAKHTLNSIQGKARRAVGHYALLLSLFLSYSLVDSTVRNASLRWLNAWSPLCSERRLPHCISIRSIYVNNLRTRLSSLLGIYHLQQPLCLSFSQMNIILFRTSTPFSPFSSSCIASKRPLTVILASDQIVGKKSFRIS